MNNYFHNTNRFLQYIINTIHVLLLMIRHAKYVTHATPQAIRTRHAASRYQKGHKLYAMPTIVIFERSHTIVRYFLHINNYRIYRIYPLHGSPVSYSHTVTSLE